MKEYIIMKSDGVSAHPVLTGNSEKFHQSEISVENFLNPSFH